MVRGWFIEIDWFWIVSGGTFIVSSQFLTNKVITKPQNRDWLYSDKSEESSQPIPAFDAWHLRHW
jgi:hypothetical protein